MRESKMWICKRSLGKNNVLSWSSWRHPEKMLSFQRYFGMTMCVSTIGPFAILYRNIMEGFYFLFEEMHAIFSSSQKNLN